MKFYLSSLFLAFSAVGSVLADEATCKKDAELVSQHVGEKYNQEIVKMSFLRLVSSVSIADFLICCRPARFRPLLTKSGLSLLAKRSLWICAPTGTHSFYTTWYTCMWELGNANGLSDWMSMWTTTTLFRRRPVVNSVQCE